MKGQAIVTGSGGFVGRHIASKLMAEGWDVLGIDLHAPVGDLNRSYEGDLRDWLATTGRRLGGARTPELVIHCAAVVGGRTMIDGAPLQLAAEDLSLDAELFRWLLTLDNPPDVVYFSSSAAYPVGLQHGCGIHAETTLRESAINLRSPALPDATYGWVKLTGERMAAEANKLGIPVYVFRPFSGYGRDQDLDYPFPSFIERAKRGDDPFEVWGDGTQVRDFIHIDDIVDAVLCRIAGDDTSPVNLCTGVGTNFLELAARTMMHARYRGSVMCYPDKPVGVQRRVGDPTRMLDFYEPKIDLDQGIRMALGLD